MSSKGRNEPFARLEWKGRREHPLAAAQLHLQSTVIPPYPNPSAQPENILLQGDNLAIMAALLPDWEGRVDLIYIDPPFLSGKAYRARIGRGEDSRRPETWNTTAGYQDEWKDGAAYLSMLYPRMQAMHRLLAPHGTLYLHLDWHAAAYARVLLDEIFGPQRFLNEIVWVYHGPSPIRSAFKRKHDTILVYTRSADYTFNADAVRIPYHKSTQKTFASSKKAGFGKTPDLDRGKVPEDWWYFPVVARLHKERTGYPTQKPEALLERVIMASSNPGDVVADFFSGAGTVASVAARLGRRWIAADASRLAIRTTQRRLALLETPAAYQLLSDSPQPPAAPPPLAIQLQQEKRTLTCRLMEKEDDNNVYWEVDWDYQGGPIHSTSQAARPWRNGTLPEELHHSYSAPGTYTILVQAFNAAGEVARVLQDITLK